MSQVAIDVPEETLIALRLDADSAGHELMFAAAVKLYEIGRLSSGAAAALAGIPRVAFLARAREFGAAVLKQTESELREDFERA